MIVRSIAGYGMPNHLRISIGLPQENERFYCLIESVSLTSGYLYKNFYKFKEKNGKLTSNPDFPSRRRGDQFTWF
ncbi:hypothetical protein INT82_13000 [Mannheimia haemolytica]|nr:hypothetical protein [Mannheimia haemolytica]